MPIINQCGHPSSSGYCQKAGRWRRQNSQYCNDLDNFGAYCEEHQEYIDQCWEEQWKEYYSSVLPATVHFEKEIEVPDPQEVFKDFLILFSIKV